MAKQLNRFNMRLGDLPRELKQAQHNSNKFRRLLEQEVMKVKGEISIEDAALINTAAKYDRLSCLANRVITKHLNELDWKDQLEAAKEIAKASSMRDKCIREIGLPRRGDDQDETTALQRYLASQEADE